MGTRAAAFTAKLRNLVDYYSRCQTGSSVTSGNDVASTLKYFSSTLLSVMKDVPVMSYECMGKRERDSVRLSAFPNLSYSTLYEAISKILDVVPIIVHGKIDMCEALLNVFTCLAPFLEHENLDSLPYQVATAYSTFPASLQKQITDVLCLNLLPVAIGYTGSDEEPNCTQHSISAIIMLAFQFVEDHECHSQLLECLLSLKKDVFHDLIAVIAYGTRASLKPAVHYLFHYWPQLNPTLLDKRSTVHSKFPVWKPIQCQRSCCPKIGKADAIKMCLDPSAAVEFGDRMPPLYVCDYCLNQVAGSQANMIVDILLPMEHVSIVCENKDCSSMENAAVCTCFSVHCANTKDSRPIRFCDQCHRERHLADDSAKQHVYHTSIDRISTCSSEMQAHFLGTIFRLLKEAHSDDDEKPSRGELDESDGDDSCKLLSRYGIWLLVELIKPDDKLAPDVLGHLLVLLFQWFQATSYLPDDNVGNSLEKLKAQYIKDWLKEITESHFEVVVSCLLPHPMSYAKIGTPWETLMSRTAQVKAAFDQFICLVPYDIITLRVWNFIIPYWLEAVRTEIPVEERIDLKVTLCKIFDMDMCSLPFSIAEMYEFLNERFVDSNSAVQDQALSWLRLLTSLDIMIPITLLIKMFNNGVSSLRKLMLEQEEKQRSAEGTLDGNAAEVNNALSSDAVASAAAGGSAARQDAPLGVSVVVEVNAAVEDSGTSCAVSSSVSSFGIPSEANSPANMSQSEGSREKSSVKFNIDSEVETFTNIGCFITMLDIIVAQLNVHDIIRHGGLDGDCSLAIMRLLVEMQSMTWDGRHTCLEEHKNDNNNDNTECKLCDLRSLWFQLSSQLIQQIIPKAKAAIPEQLLYQNGKGKASNYFEEIIPEPEEKIQFEKEFAITKMPIHLQMLYGLLKNLNDEHDADSIYYICMNINFLCQYAEVFRHCLQNDREFVQKLIRHLMIPNLWKLLQADFSQISMVVVPLIIYTLAQSTGIAVMLDLVEEDFNHHDWTVRFAAVEKATILARFVDLKTILVHQPIMSALAHIFSHLIASLSDINSSVVLRTTQYLDSIRSSSVKCIVQCLALQFDSVISDRCTIVQRLLALQKVLPSHAILSWQCFLRCFDVLSLEAQLGLDPGKDLGTLRDLLQSDSQSAEFVRKVGLARFAMSRSGSVKSITSGQRRRDFRRAESLPSHIPRSPSCCSKIDDFARQQSAPTFPSTRRDPRSFRFSVAAFSHAMFPGGDLREFTGQESSLGHLMQRAMEADDGLDHRATVHLLVRCLMWRLQADQDGGGATGGGGGSAQARSLVLEHLNVLLGFSQKENVFTVPPYKLRYSPVFNAVLAALPQLFDGNLTMGNLLLPLGLALLQYAPSPQRYATDSQPPNYSLWLLEPLVRKIWLQALSVILYKYQYTVEPTSSSVSLLMRLVINVVAAQVHECSRSDDPHDPGSPLMARNRDVSNVSDLQEAGTTSLSDSTGTDTKVNAITKYYLSDSEQTDTDTDANYLPPAQGKLPSLCSPLSTTSASEPPSPVIFSAATGEEREQQAQRIAEYQIGLLEDGTTEELKRVDKQSSFNQRSLQDSIKKFMEGASKSKFFQDDTAAGGEYKKINTQVLDEVDAAGRVGGGKGRAGNLDAEDEQKYSEESRVDAEESREEEGEGEGERVPLLKNEIIRKSSVSFQADEREEKPEKENRLGEVICEEFSPEKPDSILSTPTCSPSKHADADDETGLSEGELGKASPKKRPFMKLLKISSAGAIEVAGALQSGTKRDEQTLSDKLTRKHLTKQLPAPLELGHEKSNLSSQARNQSRYAKNQRNRRPFGLVKGSTDTARVSRKSHASVSAQNVAASEARRTAAQHVSMDVLNVDRCPECSSILEQYDEETLSLALICMGMFVHREPAVSAPLLQRMLHVAARIASHNMYQWQREIMGLVIPGNCVSAAKQFIRCSLHKFAPNGVFLQIFIAKMEDANLIRTIATVLMDFNELQPYNALLYTLEGFNEEKQVTSQQAANFMSNVGQFVELIPVDVPSQHVTALVSQLELAFRRFPGLLAPLTDSATAATAAATATAATATAATAATATAALKLMIDLFKLPALSSCKSLLEPFSKVLVFVVEFCEFSLLPAQELCMLTARNFPKERDKMLLARGLVNQLMLAVKFKLQLPPRNFVLLIQFICMDAGGTLGSNHIVSDEACFNFHADVQNLQSTSAQDCMKPHLVDAIDFISDLHCFSKIRANYPNSDAELGLLLKVGMAQFVALEFSRGSGQSNRAVQRFMPWLYHPPTTLQQGPKEFVDSVLHMRLLSWLLLGALTHTAFTCAGGVMACQPIPLEANSFIADHIMVILKGFSEQSKTSVVHMSSLFHAFILCQLWTMYCESFSALSSSTSNFSQSAQASIMDFWARVTPGVLQLLSHTKVLAEMVNLHFLALMEALQKCNSVVLSKLFPMWTHILYSYRNQLPGTMQVRLQKVRNSLPVYGESKLKCSSSAYHPDIMLKWLHDVEIKLSQIEIQSSQAAHFLSV